MKVWYWLIVLPLHACTPSSPEPPAAEPASTLSTVATTPPVSTTAAVAMPADELPGEYRIAGVDGQDIDQPSAITASITSDLIHVVADCLNFAWRYTLDISRFETTRIAAEGCARGPTPAEEAVVAALDAATAIERTPANGVELRGGGLRVTLFAQ